MRKINSDFKTSFVSEAGSQLVNNDYFGFVELDDYACYVVADGLYRDADATSAKLAIDTVIGKFQENPSIKKSSLKKYLQAANKRLIQSGTKRRSLKAAIMVVVTNYESMRYAGAGNARMTLYRGERAYIKSADMTLGQEMVELEDSSRDVLDEHRERNNMYAFLGQSKGFKPYISKKIALKETDVITLYTRGIWENVDDGELLDVFSEATDKPQDAVDAVEEMLLSRQPTELKNYTLAAIFVNKTFADPRQKKRRKKIIIFTIIAVVLIAAAVVFLILWTRHRTQMRTDMDAYLASAIVHVERGSFNRAMDDAAEARDLARRLRDEGASVEVEAHIRLIETVIHGNGLLEGRRYHEAQDIYLSALEYALGVGNIGYSYIMSRLETAEAFIDFYTLIELADGLAALSNYEVALSLYHEARTRASSLFFSEGRQQAIDGIADMLERITLAEEAAAILAAAEAAILQQGAQAAAAQGAQGGTGGDIVTATELMANGDRSFLVGDYAAALTFFQSAHTVYQELGNAIGMDMSNARAELARSRIVERERQESLAAGYATRGDAYFAAGNYDEAIRFFILARQLFENINVSIRAAQMNSRIDSARQAMERAARQTDAERESRIERADAYAALGEYHFMHRNFDQAILYKTQARQIYAELGLILRVAQMDTAIEAVHQESETNNADNENAA